MKLDRIYTPTNWRFVTAGSRRKWILAILLIGLALRLYAAWVFNTLNPDSPQRLHGDQPEYDNAAREMLAGYGFTSVSRLPGYPLFLALLYRIFDGSLHATVFTQAVLGTSVILLVYLLGRSVFHPLAGLVAAFFSAASYVLVHQPLLILTEVLYTPLLLLAVWTFWNAIQRPTLRRWIWAGVAVGLCNWVRPTMMLFPAFALPVSVALLGRRAGVRGGIVYFTVATLVIAPWVARNAIRHHRIFHATSLGILWLGSPEYFHLVRDRNTPYLKVWTDVLYGPGTESHPLWTIEGDRYWTARAVRSIRREPAVYLRYAGEKLATFWVGDPDADWAGSHVFDYRALRRYGWARWDAIQFMLSRLLPIAALVAIVTLRRRWRLLLPIYSFLLYFTLLHAATHAEARLSDPLQPVLLLLLAAAVCHWGERLLPSTTRALDRALKTSCSSSGGFEVPASGEGTVEGDRCRAFSP